MRSSREDKCRTHGFDGSLAVFGVMNADFSTDCNHDSLSNQAL